MRVSFFSEETSPLGTGGAIKNAESLINTQTFLVNNGYSLCKIDYHKYCHFHQKHTSFLSIVLSEKKGISLWEC